MVQERPAQFGGTQRFGINLPMSQVPVRLPGSSAAPLQSRAMQKGIGLGGMGLGKGHGFKRHQKIRRDNTHGVTQADIRRLARRGGVKRISSTIYDDVRLCLKQRLEIILKDVIAVVDYSGRKTVTVRDVVFSLNRLGRPIYGFNP